MLVVPTDADVEQLTADVRFFVCAPSKALSDAEVERAVLPFPSHEVDPYRGLAPHFDIASARARALHALTTGAARVVVASAAALLPRLAAPAAAGRRRADRDARVRHLADRPRGPPRSAPATRGRTRSTSPASSASAAASSTSIPAGAERPIRLEFVGDTIESIRAYDPSTQRSTGAVDQAAIVPLTELPGDPDDADRSATFFDYLALAGRPTVFVSEPDEVEGARPQDPRPDPAPVTTTRSRAASGRRSRTR